MSKKLGLTAQDLNEKAVSKAQQRYMGMVAAGKIPSPKGLSKEEARKFAKTKHKGLPDRVDERWVTHVGREDFSEHFHRLYDEAEDTLNQLKGSKYMKEYTRGLYRAMAKFEDAEDDDHDENRNEALGDLENIKSDMDTELTKRHAYMAKYSGRAGATPSHVETYVPSFKEFMTNELYESTYSEGQKDQHFTGWNEWSVEVNSRHLGEHTERHVPGWDVILVTHRMHQDHKNWVYAYWDERLGEGIVFERPKNRKDVMQGIVEKHKSAGLLPDED